MIPKGWFLGSITLELSGEMSNESVTLEATSEGEGSGAYLSVEIRGQFDTGELEQLGAIGRLLCGLYERIEATEPGTPPC